MSSSTSLMAHLRQQADVACPVEGLGSAPARCVFKADPAVPVAPVQRIQEGVEIQVASPRLVTGRCVADLDMPDVGPCTIQFANQVAAFHTDVISVETELHVVATDGFDQSDTLL